MKADTVTSYEELIPSFYTSAFREQDVLKQILSAVDLAHLQTLSNRERTDRMASVAEGHSFHTTVTEKLKLTKSTKTTITYGGDVLYDGTYEYGQQDPSILHTVYDLGDTSIISIGYIADGVEDPTHIYTEGVDFFVNRGLIVFNGTLSSLFSQIFTSEVDDLAQEDGITLFGYNVRRDTSSMFSHFGYAVDYGTTTSYIGDEIFKSIWKLFSFGPSWYHTIRVLALAVGSDVTRTSKEVILAHRSTDYGKVVITDKSTYVCRMDATQLSDSEIHYGYPVTADVFVEWDLDRVGSDDIAEGLPVGFVSIAGDGTDPTTYKYQLGNDYLEPSSIILVTLAASASSSLELKLVDIFKDLLPKSSKLVLTNFVAAASTYNPGSNTDGNMSSVAPVAIIEGQTDTRVISSSEPVLYKSRR